MPMTPHICSELWIRLGETSSLLDMEWPKADERYLTEENIIVPVQINGKKRSTITLPHDHSEDDARNQALQDSHILRIIGTEKIKKVIVVPGKIINVVI